MEHKNIQLDIVNALLKYKELHLRGIAKIINEPHANISRMTGKLVKSNILDFKIEGKNKVLRLKKGVESLNYVYMAEHFKLLKLLDKYPFLSVITESVLSKTDEGLIIIFGSFAKFNAKKDSDIDLFIETAKRKVKTEVESLNSRLSVKIGKFDKSSLLIKEIMKDHIIIRGVEYYYEKNKIFE